MENYHKDYVFLDGLWLKEEKLLEMARQAGSMAVAEHYLCAYLTNAVLNENRDAIKNLNAIRNVYGLSQIPFTDQDGDEGKPKDDTDELARKRYRGMPDEKKVELMRASLQQLMELHRNLFVSRNHWCGIFLVVRDRLEAGIKKTAFADWAKKVTPSGWPEDLTVGESTLSNFSHYVEYDDREKFYYSMRNNPWAMLCGTFWEIVKMQILTNG